MTYKVPSVVSSGTPFGAWTLDATDGAGFNTIRVGYRNWSTNHFGSRFERLRDRWMAETMFSSSLSEITSHEAYMAIIGLGQPAIPLILEDLERDPKYWFAALRALSGFDPVPSEMAGNLDAMTDAWLDWGRETGLID
jgi:hypothetical protein